MTFGQMIKRLIFKVIPARIWRNFGRVLPNLYRSGQMGPIGLFLTTLIIRPDLVIALNMKGKNNWKEQFEIWFCHKIARIPHWEYSWSAGGNVYPKECDELIEIVKIWRRGGSRIWVHCAGGVDRTGGFIGMYILRHGGTLGDFIEECSIHRTPSEGWIEAVVGEYANVSKKIGLPVNKRQNNG
jgi:hypothetical protein